MFTFPSASSISFALCAIVIDLFSFFPEISPLGNQTSFKCKPICHLSCEDPLMSTLLYYSSVQVPIWLMIKWPWYHVTIFCLKFILQIYNILFKRLIIQVVYFKDFRVQLEGGGGGIYGTYVSHRGDWGGQLSAFSGRVKKICTRTSHVQDYVI